MEGDGGARKVDVRGLGARDLGGEKCCWWVVKAGLLPPLLLLLLLLVLLPLLLPLVVEGAWDLGGTEGRRPSPGPAGWEAEEPANGPEGRRLGVSAVAVEEDGVGAAGGLRLRLVGGGRRRSAAAVPAVAMAVAVDEEVEEVCDGGRRVVALESVVTDDLARMCACPWLPFAESTVPALVLDATRGRDVGTPEEVVGLVALPDVAVRAEVDACRIDAARVGRPAGAGAGTSGPELPCSRWRVEDVDVDAMRAKTPDSGRLVFVAVPLLEGRVVVVADGAAPLTGSLLGDTFRWPSPLLLVVSGLVPGLGFRRERARDRAPLDDADDAILMSASQRIGVLLWSGSMPMLCLFLTSEGHFQPARCVALPCNSTAIGLRLAWLTCTV